MTNHKSVPKTDLPTSFLCTQAIEETPNTRYERALITVTVNPSNEFAPIITSSINSFVGYIAENSPRGTLITDFSGTQFIKLQIIDTDVVSTFFSVEVLSQLQFLWELGVAFNRRRSSCQS